MRVGSSQIGFVSKHGHGQTLSSRLNLRDDI